MKITPESAAKAYEELLRTARVEIMFEGCGDPTLAKDIFAQKFAGVKREPIELSRSLVKAQRGAVKEETERMEVKQGKLVMGFRVDGIEDYRRMNMARVTFALFGGTANSLLFKNVREKMSLCYYCSSGYDRSNSIMMVSSGVEAENAQKARDEVLHQLEMLKTESSPTGSWRRPNCLSAPP